MEPCSLLGCRWNTVRLKAKEHCSTAPRQYCTHALFPLFTPRRSWVAPSIYPLTSPPLATQSDPAASTLPKQPLLSTMSSLPTFPSVIQATRAEYAQFISITINYHNSPQTDHRDDDHSAAEESLAVLIARDFFLDMEVEPVVMRRCCCCSCRGSSCWCCCCWYCIALS